MKAPAHLDFLGHEGSDGSSGRAHGHHLEGRKVTESSSPPSLTSANNFTSSLYLVGFINLFLKLSHSWPSFVNFVF